MPTEWAQHPISPAIDDEAYNLARGRGMSVQSTPAGFKLVELGGNTHHFNTLDEAKQFLKSIPERHLEPVEASGTLEKIVNDQPLTDVDKAAITTQRAVSSLPRVTPGHTLNEGIPVGIQFNVVTGLHTPEEIAAAQAAVVAKGYKPGAPIRVGNEYELPYAAKWNSFTKRAVNTYASLRIRGPNSVHIDDVRRMGALMGMRGDVLTNFLWHVASKAGQDIKTQKLYLGQLASPTMVGSPTVAQVAREIVMAVAQLAEDERWAYTNIRDRFLRPLTEKEAIMAGEVVEGTRPFSSVSLKIQQAVNAYRQFMAELARLAGIPQWENYMTHATDMDALWAAVRESILRDGAWAKRVDARDLDQLRLLAAQYTGKWDTLPKDVQRFIRDKALRWENTEWSKLPETIRRQLPEEVFNRYLIPRVGGAEVPYEKNLIKVFDKYVPVMLRYINVQPALERVRPIIAAMPGADNPLSARRFLEKYVNEVALNRFGDARRALDELMRDMGNSLGISMTKGSLLNDMITLYRGGTYRGLIGIDSALKHFNKIVNVAAENGKFLPYAFKYLPQIIARKGIVQVPGVTRLHGAELTELLNRPPRGTTLDKAMRLSDFISGIALRPMQIVENTMRGFSWYAGLEEAAQLGMDTKTAIRYAARKASTMLPDIKMTEAQYHALLNVIKTDFGYSIEHAPPWFNTPLARLSTIFMTYPIREIEFLARGIGTSLNGFLTMAEHAGAAEALRTADAGRLLRYLASSGFLLGAAYYAAKLGVDMTNFFTGHLAHVALPFWQATANLYNAIAGREPWSRERATREFKEAIYAAAIPQYRMLKKASNAIESVRRGYAVDDAGRYIHPSSPFGEFMNFLGIPPTAYTRGRKLAEEWAAIAKDYNYEKHAAIEAMVRSGDTTAVQDFMVKWGRPITPEDVKQVAETMEGTPVQRATRTVPMEVIKRMAQERPYLFEK